MPEPTTDLTPAQAVDVAFHVTDWLGDLDHLLQFYVAPAALSDQEVHRLLVSLLVHVPNYAAAAAALLADCPVNSIFRVGAVKRDE